jgi:outer membrane protein OmpA-like peptidoglycan-associated protein
MCGMAFLGPFRLRELVIRSGLLGPAVLALCAGMALAPVARAQPAGPSGAVTVDWGALDALGAGAASAAAPVRLTAPPRRIVAVLPPPEKPVERPPAPALVLPPKAPAVASAAAPPPVSPAPASTPAASPPQQVASAAIPRAAGVPALPPGRVTMVRYVAGSSDIPEDGRAAFDSVAATLAANDKLHLQLVAYASGNRDDAVSARRISLTRAVQMRAYLIAKGVPSIRMEVRALGDQNVGSGPADRVDLVIAGP